MLLNIKEAACAMNGEYRGSGEKTIAGMFTDSRESFEGGMFFALPGERVNGHVFVAEMNEKGFPCVVSDKRFFTGENILVKNTERALGDLARWWREKHAAGTKVVAVTGSVGKTTTKDMIGEVLSSTYNTYVPKGNKNSTIGLPTTVAKLVPSYEYAVFELGSSDFGEISYLSNIVHPSVSVITCIGSSHLEHFHTRDNIRKEKYGILDGQEKGGHVILDGDSDADYAMREKLTDYKPVYCGFSERCDFRIEMQLRSDKRDENLFRRNDFTVTYGKRTYDAHVYVMGDHMAKNATYAFAAGVLNGVDPEIAATALGRYVPYGDRLRIYNKDGVTVIADCYNASPESMKAALEVLERFGRSRKIAVLGDMLELGDDSEPLHEEIALKAAFHADILIYVGYYANVFADACNLTKKVKCFDLDQKTEAAEYIKGLLAPGDVVLFKASRGVGLEKIIKEAGL
ncbi:MAG: UDP-N-acetylmuramoyl-tripeptide--D-alanyl-D-alanine ligase [Clostridia bacterium]|nr:UDP-N-acetylmuramoyl-tripeptide--D-alanyl-D-alanine ligase [Clostridia bacterium]